MSKYINTPDIITIKEIEEKDYSLSAPQFKTLLIENKNNLFVRDFLERNLQRSDLGNEVGSLNYIGKSSKYFLRTKALQNYSFLPEINSETTKPIYPKVFYQMNLRKGDLIISKDSNIGEIIILNKDYPNHMLQSALYRLPVKEATKYYLLAFIKHRIFREQLDFIVPSGATIRHAKTLFLDCKISIPNSNKKQTMLYVSLLTQAIINKEKEIQNKHELILDTIKTELDNNQKANVFNFLFPKYDDLQYNDRLDSTFYSEKHQQISFKTTNYSFGYKSLDNQGLLLKPGPSLEIRLLGTRLNSNKPLPGFYRLITPKQILNSGILKDYEFIGTPRDIPRIQFGDILFGESGTGRTMVYLEDNTNTINNAHAHILRPIEGKCSLEKAITIRCIMQYYKEVGLIDCLTVGGAGGHLSPSYFDRVYIPNFQQKKQKEIAKLYYNPKAKNRITNATLKDFLELDNKFNKQAGIYELDRTAKQLKKRLDEVIDKIANDERIEILFNEANV